MRIALTGGSGFVGSWLVRSLQSVGQVVALTRFADGINEADTKIVVGTLEDREALDGLLQGADVVVHSAGIVRTADEAMLHAVNVEGTAAVARAATRSGARRLVLVSTAGVYGRPGGRINEAARVSPPNAYEWSKLGGEREARRHFDGELCIIRPTNILGLGHPMQPLLRLARRVQTGQVVVGPNACANYVPVGAVAAIATRVATAPSPPEVLIVNQPMPLAKLVWHLGDGTDRGIRMVPGLVSEATESALRTLYTRVPLLERPFALFDSTSMQTAHEDFVRSCGSVPLLEDELRAMLAEYRRQGLL